MERNNKKQKHWIIYEFINLIENFSVINNAAENSSPTIDIVELYHFWHGHFIIKTKPVLEVLCQFVRFFLRKYKHLLSFRFYK